MYFISFKEGGAFAIVNRFIAAPSALFNVDHIFQFTLSELIDVIPIVNIIEKCLCIDINGSLYVAKFHTKVISDYNVTCVARAWNLHVTFSAY